ncbi:MAG: biopolymer transporter ExbD [Bacteroidota bacterium]|nr:biopolymer transporter ExbD [Bacteroidota bacterium]
MAKKEIEEINAGSMADIAFLLLIFFLITTTMNLPQVHEERLPQKSEMEILLNKTNVLQIQATKTDKIAIEEEFAELEDIKEAVRDFYVHKKGDPRWPEYTEVNKKKCEDTLLKLDEVLKVYPDAPLYNIERGIWSSRLEAVNLIGAFPALPNSATVSIQLDNATSYDIYMQVLDQIMIGLNSLRDELSLEKFGVPFSKLNKKVDSDKAKISAIRQVYPKRIMKEKNRSVQ